MEVQFSTEEQFWVANNSCIDFSSKDKDKFITILPHFFLLKVFNF